MLIVPAAAKALPGRPAKRPNEGGSMSSPTQARNGQPPLEQLASIEATYGTGP